MKWQNLFSGENKKNILKYPLLKALPIILSVSLIWIFGIVACTGPLTLSILGKIFSRRHINFSFSYYFQKTGFDISCKLSPMDYKNIEQCRLQNLQKVKKNVKYH